MKFKFLYVFNEQYEGDEVRIVPSLGPAEKVYESQKEGFAAFMRGEDDYLYFISNLDSLEKAVETEQKVKQFLADDNKDEALITDGYVRKAKIKKDFTTFNLDPERRLDFRGAISTQLFLKILTAWKEYLESGIKDDIVVDIV